MAKSPFAWSIRHRHPRQIAGPHFRAILPVDPARSRETGGSGLGLAITKHCVQENGGRISVWSRTGEGSTFTIELPAAPDEDDDEARSDESTQA